MSSLVERLEYLGHPMAEAMPDGARLTEAVKACHEAAREIKRLLAIIRDREGEIAYLKSED